MAGIKQLGWVGASEIAPVKSRVTTLRVRRRLFDRHRVALIQHHRLIARLQINGLIPHHSFVADLCIA